MQEGGHIVRLPLIALGCHKGPYIKYVEGGPEGLRILMGHEIFLKIFYGPQNIFLCFLLVILIFKLRESEHKISKLAIKEI